MSHPIFLHSGSHSLTLSLTHFPDLVMSRPRREPKQIITAFSLGRQWLNNSMQIEEGVFNRTLALWTGQGMEEHRRRWVKGAGEMRTRENR